MYNQKSLCVLLSEFQSYLFENISTSCTSYVQHLFGAWTGILYLWCLPFWDRMKPQPKSTVLDGSQHASIDKWSIRAGQWYNMKEWSQKKLKRFFFIFYRSRGSREPAGRVQNEFWSCKTCQKKMRYLQFCQKKHSCF